VSGERGAQERGLTVERQFPCAEERQGKAEGKGSPGARRQQGKPPPPDQDLGKRGEVGQDEDAEERHEDRLGQCHGREHQQPCSDDAADYRKLSALPRMAHVLHHPREAGSLRT
jgi:hypothetical protein